MTADKLIVQVYTPYIRARILGMARHLARDARRYRRAFRDLVAWAWIRIAESPEGWTDAAYLKAGFSEMYRYYEANIKARDYEPRNLANDRAVQRVRRFYLKKG